MHGIPIWLFPTVSITLLFLGCLAVGFAFGRMAASDDARRDDDDYRSAN